MQPVWIHLVAVFWLLVSLASWAGDGLKPNRIASGERFLTNLFDARLDLLPEYAGAKVYWLFHDNYLAAHLLESSRPDLAHRIRNVLRKYEVTRSGKIEILFGGAPDAMPFRQFQLVTVTSNEHGIIRTERLLDGPLVGWEHYVDLLLFAALAEAASHPARAREHYEQALKMWDGRGFFDPATKQLGIYSTYKLALAVLASQRLGHPLPMREAIRDRLERLQAESGGWITDYDPVGNPRGMANVETTCMVMLALKSLAEPPRSGRDRRPNIIFVLADDLGYGDLGCFGQKRIRTPNLDRLAAQGMRFTQHYSGNAVCAPSRCVLLTGKHPGHAWIRNNQEVQPEGQPPIPAGTLTLPKLLRAQGYATAAVGKWGLGFPGSEGDPLKQGFDRFFGYNCQRHAHNYYPTSLWDNDRRVMLSNDAFAAHQKLPADADPKNPASYARFAGSQYAPDLIREEALRFIRDHRDRPFFLYYASTVPHLALQVPPDSVAQYAGQFPDEPYPGGQGYLPHRTPRAAYAGMVTRLDQDIGQVMEVVKSLGLDDNTIFVFTSDNGPLWGRFGGTDSEFFNSAGPWRGRKGSLWEGGVRVPLIVRWPGRIAAGQVSERVTGFEDWLPTLLQLAGAGGAVPLDVDGISFAPTLRGQSQPERPFLYREFPASGGWQMVRAGPWKALRQGLNPAGAKARSAVVKTELYQLEKDPGETRDLSAEHPDIVARLEKIMQEQHVPSALFPFPQLDRGAQTRH